MLPYYYRKANPIMGQELSCWIAQKTNEHENLCKRMSEAALAESVLLGLTTRAWCKWAEEMEERYCPDSDET